MPRRANIGSGGAAARRFVLSASILTTSALALGGCWYGQTAVSNPSVNATTSPSSEAPGAASAAAPIPPPSTDKIPPVGPTWLEIDEVNGLGTVVVDGSGRTVYSFTRDTTTKSTCYDTCADTWLPLLASGNPAGGIGINVAEAQTVPRGDGSNQVTYKGHPLYRYAGDTAPGQANGHGIELFGGEWNAMTPAGDAVD